jgi:hypothetical protein
MFTRFISPVRMAQGRRFSSLHATLVASLLGVVALTGCGGGGGGSTIPFPEPTATPIPVATASPRVEDTAKDRSVTSNFLPNYAPDTASSSKRYLRWASNKNIRVFIRPSVNTISDNAPNTNINDATVRSVVDQ